MKGTTLYLPVLCFILSICFFSLESRAQAQCRINLLSATHDCAPAVSIFNRMDSSGKKTKSVLWDFGDASTSADSAFIVSHNFASAGTYLVKVTITYADNTTCTATLPQGITISNAPKAVINLPAVFPYGSTQCFQRDGKPNKFVLTQSSIRGSKNAPIVSYLWNFGDGSTSPDSSVSHTYLAPGKYTICLTVTDVNGCTSTVCKTAALTVLNDIKANVKATTNHACNMAAYTLTNTVDTTGMDIKSFFWDFGDGSPGDNKNFNTSHVYYPGFYDINFTVTNINGCQAKASITVNVQKFEMHASFKDTLCWADARDNGVTFTAQKQPNVTYYHWDFGEWINGTESSAKFQWTATHKFTNGPGNYQVHFIMVNANPKCGTLDTCLTVHIKGPMAAINLPKDRFWPNNYEPARPMPKTDFAAITNNPGTCGPQAITYATFVYQKNVRHVKYGYCHATVLSKRIDSTYDCYGLKRLPYTSIISLKPTDSTVSTYTDSFETRTVWKKGDNVPKGVVYYPAFGHLVWNNMHDSNLTTCKLPNLVRFTNNSIKYRLLGQMDDSTYRNVNVPEYSFRDTCVWKNYPMASDSLQYFWKFNDPSGKACTSTVSNKNWDCNFSTLAAPYHYYRGLKGLPANGVQLVSLSATDPVIHCADSTVLELKQGPPNAYWDRSMYCKMNWDMQQALQSPASSIVPRMGFSFSGQSSPCNGPGYPMDIDFGGILPSGGGTHWWVTFDSASTTSAKACQGAGSTVLDYGFLGNIYPGYTPGKNNYPAAGADSYWQGPAWGGRYWYENGDTGCKTIGIVIQNGTCFDTAWYHDFICFNRLEPYFNIFAVDSSWQCGSTGDFKKDGFDSQSIFRIYGPKDPAHPKGHCKGQYAYYVNNQRFIDDTKTSTHGHICQSHPTVGFEGVRVRLFPENAYQKDITSFRYKIQRRAYYDDPTYKNSSWYYSLPFWPDSASLTPFTTWDDSVRQVKTDINYIDTPNLYIILNQPGLPAHKTLANFPLYQSEIDSLTKTLASSASHTGHVNIPATDPRIRAIATACGKAYITLYTNKIAIARKVQALDLKGFGAVDSLTLPYPGFYTVITAAANLEGCVQTSRYHLIYGHFATFNVVEDSVTCVGNKLNFNYYVRYWSTHCPYPPGGGQPSEGCLNGYDEDAGGRIPNTLDFAPWDNANPLAYRMGITGGNFKAPDNLLFSPEKMYWNFGDDNIYYQIPTGGKASHAYNKPGVYTVTMRTIDWRGCAVNTVRQNLIKVVQPLVDFKLVDPADSVSNCTPATVRFVATAKMLGGTYHQKLVKNGYIIDSVFVVDTIQSYTWAPGDGRNITTNLTDTFSVIYNTVDSFDVGVTGNTMHGCGGTTIKHNYVTVRHIAPDAQWTYTPDNKGKTFFTNDNTHYPSYSWDFGDGGTSNIPSPVHSYTKNGTYVVTCQVTSIPGCVGEYTEAIKITSFAGLDEADEKLNSLTIYPNPFQTGTTVSYNLMQTANIRILVFDITGKQIVAMIQEKQLPGSYQADINAEKYHLHPGIYLLKFMVDDHVVSKHIVYSGGN